MAASHPLAAVADLTLDQVLAEPTFDFPTPDKAWHDYWMATQQRGGNPPRIVAQFRTLDALIEVLRSGLGVHTATKPLFEAAGHGLVWREVDGLAPLEHFIAWRAGDTRPEVADFAHTALEAFAQPG
jgi:DNA-binding transcriptional LysR family regulator